MKEKKMSTFVGDSTYVRAHLHIEVPCGPIMETYFSTLPVEGGKIGLHLKKKDSESWNILKNVEHYSTNAIQSLDAKLMDADIEKTLEKMFPGESLKMDIKDLDGKIGFLLPSLNVRSFNFHFVFFFGSLKSLNLF
jgi:hypothetical protein